MRISKHLYETIGNRIGMGWSEFIKKHKDEEKRYKKGDYCEFPRVAWKLKKSYDHQIMLVYPSTNVFVAYDPITNKLCSLMWIDGSDGYDGNNYYTG